MNLTGLVTGDLHSDSLEKLTVTYRRRNKPVTLKALFNPAEISRSRSVEWEQPKPAAGQWAPETRYQEFIAVQPETLSVSLFFDSYESHADADNRVVAGFTSLVTTANPFAGGSSSDVTDLTRPFAELAQLDQETHWPPVCRLSWGGTPLFWGVLTQLDQRFTMWLPDGTPVRATLDCTFAEYQTRAGNRARELHSADVVKTRVLKRGETLHSLAAEEYGDSARWREIARANRIVNPLRVRPGAQLIIPRLDG